MKDHISEKKKKKNSFEKFNFSSETDHRAHVLKS